MASMLSWPQCVNIISVADCTLLDENCRKCDKKDNSACAACKDDFFVGDEDQRCHGKLRKHTNLTPSVTLKLTGPCTATDKTHIGPVNFLCIIIFTISEIKAKFILGLVKAKSFCSDCPLGKETPTFKKYKILHLSEPLSQHFRKDVWLKIHVMIHLTVHPKEYGYSSHFWGLYCGLPMVDSLIARFMGRTWGTPVADNTQLGPMLAPWTLLSGFYWYCGKLQWGSPELYGQPWNSLVFFSNCNLFINVVLCNCNILHETFPIQSMYSQCCGYWRPGALNRSNESTKKSY